jgi:hypothetical protein
MDDDSSTNDDDDDSDVNDQVDLQQTLDYSSGIGYYYNNIRIHFVTDLLEQRRGESTSMDDRLDYLLSTALPRAAQEWSRHLYVFPVQGSIDVASDACYGAFGTDLPAQLVSNADLVVIVSARDTFLQDDANHTSYSVCESRTLAIGSPCQLDQYDRPIVGFINFCLDFEPPDVILQTYMQTYFSKWLRVDLQEDRFLPDYTDVAVHEMAHLLVFTDWLYKYFRTPDGTPRTPRPFQDETRACADGSTLKAKFPSRTTVNTTFNSEGRLTLQITTPRVAQVARNQFGCDSMTGARLEDQSGTCLGSHWHERLFLGEIMSPAMSSSSENILSPLTLALLEDSGWYRVDYSNASVPTFGLGAGCDFVYNSCIQNEQVPAWGSGMFCSNAIRFTDGYMDVESLDNVLCDPSHHTWTLCDLWDKPTVPQGLTEFPESTVHYFSDVDLVPSFPLAEFCPLPTKSLGLDCTQEDDSYPAFYSGESVGQDSRCINAFYVRNEQTTRRPACMKIVCDANNMQVLIQQGIDIFYVCEYDGQILESDGFSMECPRFAAVCPELFTCPSSCSGRGVCHYDNGATCVCEDPNAIGPGCHDVLFSHNETSLGYKASFGSVLLNNNGSISLSSTNGTAAKKDDSTSIKDDSMKSSTPAWPFPHPLVLVLMVMSFATTMLR